MKPGLFLRPLLTLVALGGMAGTVWFQRTFLRDDVMLDLGGFAVLGLAHLPYLVLVAMVWRRGSDPSRVVRVLLAMGALALLGASWTVLSAAFLEGRTGTSGRAFITTPLVQALVVVALALSVRAARRTRS